MVCLHFIILKSVTSLIAFKSPAYRAAFIHTKYIKSLYFTNLHHNIYFLILRNNLLYCIVLQVSLCSCKELPDIPGLHIVEADLMLPTDPHMLSNAGWCLFSRIEVIMAPSLANIRCSVFFFWHRFYVNVFLPQGAACRLSGSFIFPTF